MRKALFSVLWTLIVVALFGVLNGVVYVRYFLPPGFREATYRTYLPLMASISVATLIGGYIGYRVRATGKLLVKISLGICYAFVVASLVSYLSLFIILNMRGS